MHRLIKCHGSIDAQDDGEAGEAADNGTRIHDLAANALLLGVVDAPNKDEAHDIQLYVDYVRAWEEQLSPCDLIVEETLVSRRIDEFGGTADVLLVSQDTVHVIDLKTGRVPVDPHDNYQLMSYLVLAREKYPHVKKFFGSIVQPVVTTKPEAVEYSYSQLLDFNLELLEAIGSYKMAAGSHCRYCPLLPNCETANAYTLECAAFEPVEGMSLERIEQILETLVVIQALEAHAKKEMFARLMRGETLPGWRLGKSMGNRKFADEEAVIKALKAAKLKKADYIVEKLLTPAQLEKVDKKAKAIVDKYAIREENGIIVVEQNSKVAPYDPAALFEDITNVEDQKI